MPADKQSPDPRSNASPRSAMTFVFMVVFVAALVAVVYGLLPSLGVSPNAGVSFREDPLLAAMLCVLGIGAIAAIGYLSAIVAASIGLRTHTNSAVETEFRWLLSWFNWDPKMHGTLFNRLFGKN